MNLRILFVTHYFHPEVGAPQARILETALHLAERGHDVTVLTGMPHYPHGRIPDAYRGAVLRRERLGPLRVVRSAVYATPNRGFARRLLNHLSFALSATAAAPATGPADVVIVESPPLFLAAAGAVIARQKRAPMVLNVADLWPESAVQLGALTSPRAIALATALEEFAYRRAACVTVPTRGIERALRERGWGDRVRFLPNAVDVRRFGDHARMPAARRAVYCGTVGLAQGVGTIVDAGRRLHARQPDAEVVIVGDGAEREALERSAAGVSTVRFADPVPRERVPDVLADARVAVLSLRDLPIFEGAVPTKLLEYMAAGRPVVASAAGEAAALVERAGAGRVCRPEDPDALAEAIAELLDDPERARQHGVRGRRYVEEHLSRQAIAGRLEGVLLELVARRGACEAERIETRYRAYAASGRTRRAWSAGNAGNRVAAAALRARIARALAVQGAFPPSTRRPVLDVGCGDGGLLRWLADRGAPEEALHGVDLLPSRVERARQAVPGASIEQGDARTLPHPDGHFAGVILSTVLSSVLDDATRREIAREALRVVADDGVVLCYDMRVPSPRNRAVRPLGRRRLRELFAGVEVTFESLTLAPPLARRLGARAEALYPLAVRLPALRTHLLTTIRPASRDA